MNQISLSLRLGGDKLQAILTAAIPLSYQQLVYDCILTMYISYILNCMNISSQIFFTGGNDKQDSRITVD